MKKTKLYEIHKSLGANMINFAGFKMPISYGSIINEHKSVRNNVGIFDISHMGQFLVEGKNAEDFLQYCCSNDVKKIFIGRAQYNYLPNLNGGIIDDLIVYKIEKEKFLLVVNASNIQKDWEHLKLLNKEFNADLKNISDNVSLLSIQGPNSIKLLSKISDFNFGTLKNYMNCITNVAGVKEVIVASTGYTGAGGYEIYCNNENVRQIWDTLLNEGKELSVLPIGLGARDSLRLEMGYCLYGNELNEQTTPIEAGLSWITKHETCFIGSNSIQDNLPSKKLIALISEERAIPRSGYKIFSKEKKEVGLVTSGGMSPCLKKGIALAYVDYEMRLEKEFLIGIRDNFFIFEKTKLPFYKNGTYLK